MATTIPALNPPPMRDQLVNKNEQSGISRTWYLWFLALYNALIAQVQAITGLTITASTQANLTTLSASLQPNSLVFVTDYNHLLEWNGAAYNWGPGESGSGYISPFLSAPGATGWHLCNGATVNRLNGDGTITAVTLPNYATASYLKLGTAAAAGPSAASGATAAVSAGTPAGTNSAPDTGDDTDAGFKASADPAGTLVALNPHIHTTTAPVFTGAALAPHSHGPGTLELERTQLEAWYRR